MELIRQPVWQRLRAHGGPVLLLRPDLTIVDASDAYLRVTRTWLDEIRGRRMFDVFPDNPHDPAADGARNLATSFARVLAEGARDTMPTQRYDVRDHVAREREWLERHWSPMNTPLFGADSREIAYVVHSVEDVTDLVKGLERLDETLAARSEQREAVRRMLADVERSYRDLEQRRRRLRRVLRAIGRRDRIERAPDLVPTELQRSAREYLTPGEVAPMTGIYDVLHRRHCFPGAPRATMLGAGSPFPRCLSCGDDVRYCISPRFARL